MPRAWEIGYTQPCIKCQGKSATHFVYFWSRKNLPYTHLETTSYIPQQGQSLHIWTTSLSTTGCYKNKYIIQFLWMACISQFATAILSSETELTLGTIRVNIMLRLRLGLPDISFARVFPLKICMRSLIIPYFTHVLSDHCCRVTPLRLTQRARVRSGQFPGWGFFPGYSLNRKTNVRKFRPHSSLGIICSSVSSKPHILRLRTATVSDLSCSTWPSLNNKPSQGKLHKFH